MYVTCPCLYLVYDSIINKINITIHGKNCKNTKIHLSSWWRKMLPYSVQECRWVTYFPSLGPWARRYIDISHNLWLWLMASATPDPRLPSQTRSTATLLWAVLISRPAKGRRLSWPKWLVTYQEGPRWLRYTVDAVTHHSTNRAGRRATSLMRPKPLPSTPNRS